MKITTRGIEKTIDPPIPSDVEKKGKDNDMVVEGSGEAEQNTGEDAKVHIKMILMPRPTISSEIGEKDRGW